MERKEKEKEKERVKDVKVAVGNDKLSNFSDFYLLKYFLFHLNLN